MTDWNRKEEWRKNGKDFLIVVSRHEVKLFDAYEGPHRWAVYAYIYPAHPHFAKFEGKDMYQDAADLGFHGGCTFFCYHRGDAGEVNSVQCGGDYNHLHDDRFTRMATKEDAYSVFRDADDLFEKLTNMGKA